MRPAPLEMAAGFADAQQVSNRAATLHVGAGCLTTSVPSAPMVERTAQTRRCAA